MALKGAPQLVRDGGQELVLEPAGRLGLAGRVPLAGDQQGAFPPPPFLSSVRSSMATRIFPMPCPPFHRTRRALSTIVRRPELGKIVLHLEIQNLVVVRKDGLQRPAQLGKVPLAVAELVEEPAFCGFPLHLEGVVKGAVRPLDPQPGVQHEQGLAHRLDDGVREVAASATSSAARFKASMSTSTITAPSIRLSRVL